MVLHVTNATSRKAPKRGPGHLWTIMAMPRVEFGEDGEGSVPDLVPETKWVLGAKDGTLPMATYCEHYLARMDWPALAPGRLMAVTKAGDRVHVANGDTLVCCCSADKAKAGLCHRAWAAFSLYASGWEVVLDGVAIEHSHDYDWSALWETPT